MRCFRENYLIQYRKSHEITQVHHFYLFRFSVNRGSIGKIPRLRDSPGHGGAERCSARISRH